MLHRLLPYCRIRAANARRRLKYEGWRGVVAACRREGRWLARRTIFNIYRRCINQDTSSLCCLRTFSRPSSPLPFPHRRNYRFELPPFVHHGIYARKQELLECQAFKSLTARIRQNLKGERVERNKPPIPPAPLLAPSSAISDQKTTKTDLRHAYLSTARRLDAALGRSAEEAAATITNSPLMLLAAPDLLFRCLVTAGVHLFLRHPPEKALQFFGTLCRAVRQACGVVTAIQLVSRLELELGLRRPRLAIYDHAFHFAGGAQRYVAEIAHAVQDRYEVTYLVNQEMHIDQCREWYGLDLSRCALKVVKIPPAEQPETGLIDEGRVAFRRYNAFDVIGLESLNYDIFINANMLSKVNPLALCSVFICHFPHTEKDHFFQVDKYDYLVANSEYTISWTKKRWGLTPTHLLYPPVEMYHPDASADAKEKIILSVSRFEPAGSKKQLELVRAFADLARQAPAETAGWRLVLAGGSIPDNGYLAAVLDAAKEAPRPIEVHVNKSWEEIRDLYRRAAIFWHACGLDETRPERVEHFGMTTVEAMQNFCVPVVINGGGQREIVEEGVHGFLFSSLEELRDKTLRLIHDEKLRQRMAGQAYERSHRFNRQAFLAQVKQLFDAIETELCGVDCLPPAPQTTSEQALALDEEHSP